MNAARRSRSRRTPPRSSGAGSSPPGRDQAGHSQPRSRTLLVLGVVAAAVVVIALVAVLLTRDDDDGDLATAPGAADGAATDATGITAAPGAADGTRPAAGAPVDPLAATIEVGGTALPPGEGADDAAVGSPAPALRGTDYTGQPVEVRPGSQGPTMVVFLAHWCPHCNDEIPVLLEWRDSGAIPENLNIVGVSTGVAPDRPNYPPDEWLVERGWAWPVIADDASASASQAYGVTGYPFFAVVGDDGTIRARNSGELPVEALDALVAAALTG